MYKKLTHNHLFYCCSLHHFFLLPLLMIFSDTTANINVHDHVHVNIGLVLDMNSWAGNMSSTCISMALSDFYDSHDYYKTRLDLHIRDSNNTVTGAADAAVYLMRNASVQAILGPQTSMQANFVINLGQEAEVPIISFSATSPSLSSLRSRYFIRATQNDSFQAQAISSLVQAFGWRAAVPIYVDTEFGEGIIPYLADALQEVEAHIPYRSVIHPSATDIQIVAELYKLMTMQTRVFIVHMPPTLGYRLFAHAKDVGMMTQEYVWIITTGMTNHLSFIHPSAKESMQGVLGVKPHVPRRKKLNRFVNRWKRKNRRLIRDGVDLNFFGLWAYDAATALAMAVERTHVTRISRSSSFDHEISAVLRSRTRFNGLTGAFKVVDGELQSSHLQIVNILSNGEERGIGFWTPGRRGITRTLKFDKSSSSSSSKASLKGVIWPGQGTSTSTPKGWVIPTNGKKLRIGIPVRSGLNAFVNIIRDPCTNKTTFTGYSIDVFDSVMNMLPYHVPYEYVPFEKPDGESAGTYSDLVYQVYLRKFDAAAGDITIRANRSTYADFTQPYTESGITMVVPVRDTRRKNAWAFLKPLTWDLWVISACFFVFIGIVIWILERRTNEDFGGSRPHQLGTGLWFSFSTLVFAHREKVVSNIARFVVIVWCCVVLILTQSYTASLTSMLTIQQLEPTIAHVQDVIKNADINVGYQKGSFIEDYLQQQLKFDKSRLKEFDTLEELELLFSKDKAQGGIAAVFDETPSMKLFLSKHCSKYTMVTPLTKYKTDGFGFAFPIGSPLVPDVSRAVLKLMEGDKIVGIEKEWLGQQSSSNCPEQSSTSTVVSSHSLGINSFWGLFLIVGIASFIALIIFGFMLMYEHRHLLNNSGARDLLGNILVSFPECFMITRKMEEDPNSSSRHVEMMTNHLNLSNHMPMHMHAWSRRSGPSGTNLSNRSSSSSSSSSSISTARCSSSTAAEHGNSFA